MNELHSRADQTSVSTQHTQESWKERRPVWLRAVSRWRKNKAELLQKKQDIGEVATKHYDGPLEDSFRMIGKSNAETIQKTLAYILADSEQLKPDRTFTDACFAHTKEKIVALEQAANGDESALAYKIATGLQRYLTCLEQWAIGAKISVEDAWFLQFEQHGCQTVLVNGTDGDVLLAHTEEWYTDPESVAILNNHAEWSTFTDGNDAGLQAFTGYPTAMPGTSVTMLKKVISAVDSLEYRTDSRQTKGVPAAATQWLCWILGDTVDAAEIIEYVGEHVGNVGGFALNQIVLTDTGPRGKCIEYVGNKVAVQELDDSPLAYRVQTNKITDPVLDELKGKKRLTYRKYYQAIQDTHSSIREGWRARWQRNFGTNTANVLPKVTLETLEKELALLPFATRRRSLRAHQVPNSDTISTFVASMDRDGKITARISAGPQVLGNKN